MEQIVRVTQCLPDGRAQILCHRASACSGSCSQCGGGCSELERQDVLALADNPIGAAPGDLVLVQTRPGTVLGAAMLVYVLPLVLCFAGLPFLGGWGALIGFGLGFGLAAAADRYLARTSRVTMTITAFADHREA